MNLLLHTCCGPCMTAFNKYFHEKGIDFSAYFYNPNIQPYKEYLKRRNTFLRYAAESGVKSIVDESFMQSKWEDEFIGLPDIKRCQKCYEIRIGVAALKAEQKGFTHFTTTLLISPYQNHELIIEICRREAEKNKIQFFYEDFRTMFRDGQKIAADNGMYRQKYCGCIYSYNSSDFRKKINWD